MSNTDFFKRIPPNAKLGQSSETPDEYTREEHKDHDTQKKLQELKEKDQELGFRREVHEARITYAKKVYALVVWWLIAIGALIFAGGLVCLDNVFHLSDKLMITILTSTTVTVVGLFATVLKFLFANNNHKSIIK